MNRMIFVLFAGLLTLASQAAVADGAGNQKITGTWSLALDAGPFGIPGFALTGLATFHKGGTVQFADAGDFGSLGTRDSNQFGIWRRIDGGFYVRNLMLSADPATGEPLFWQRVTIYMGEGVNADQLVGTVNVEHLRCEPVTGLPGALTCPDPVARGDEFAAAPPFDVPVQLHRLR